MINIDRPVSMVDKLSEHKEEVRKVTGAKEYDD